MTMRNRGFTTNSSSYNEVDFTNIGRGFVARKSNIIVSGLFINRTLMDGSETDRMLNMFLSVDNHYEMELSLKECTELRDFLTRAIDNWGNDPEKDNTNNDN